MTQQARAERHQFAAAEREIIGSYEPDFRAAILNAVTFGIGRVIRTPKMVTVELTEDVAPLRASVHVRDGSIDEWFKVTLKSVHNFEGTYFLEHVQK